MSGRRGAAGWQVVAIVGGAVSIGVMWLEFRRESVLAMGADTVTASVETVLDDLRHGRRSSNTWHVYTVQYRFVRDTTAHLGSFECGCPQVAAMRFVDSIPVLVARRAVGVNRPAAVPVRRRAVTLGVTLLGALAALLGAWSGVRRLFERASEPGDPGFRPVRVPRRRRR